MAPTDAGRCASASRTLPTDFNALLTESAAHNAERARRRRLPLVDCSARHLLLDTVIARRKAQDCVAILDEHLFDTLEPIDVGVPRSSISRMTENYTELLPKTMRVKTSRFDDPRAPSTIAAEAIGLLDLLASPGLRHFAEAVTHLRLCDSPGAQVLLHEVGSYVGPHNDHHPEAPRLRRGFIDVHIHLPNPGVAHQWLVYERDRHFSSMTNLCSLGSVSINFLPFWHYTTPLVAKSGHEKDARRWLLLASYEIRR